MKKIIVICVTFLMTANVWAQAPEKMGYQAVVRDADNELVSSTKVGMQISILQGSATGTAVYVETQTPTTNTNGLVSLEIGTGIVVSGTFATIDWANDTYFIKTEIDPTGGTSYNITGTSQLLSVPYALHAKTANNGITSTQAATLSNTSGINTGDQDLSGLASKTALADSTAQVRSEIPTVTTYSIGDFAQGGIVFWVDETRQHGLVCAKDDQSTGVRWYAGTYGNTQAKGDGPYAGKANTTIIIAVQAAIGDDGAPYAARICNELQITEGGKTYGDWYLPSKEELNKINQNKAAIETALTANGGSGFGTNTYWSSTENVNYFAWYYRFGSGYSLGANKEFTYRVRAVRAF